MYGLFKNSYDYYEWHDLVVVSSDKSKLIEEAKKIPFPLLGGKKQQEAKDDEKTHLVICKIKKI